MLSDTMVTRIVGCVGKIAGIFFKRVPGPMMLFLAAKLLWGFGRTHSVLRELGVEEGSAFSQEECCTLYRLVADLYRENPLNVHCSAERLLEEVECPADPMEGMTGDERREYLAGMTEAEVRKSGRPALMATMAMEDVSRAFEKGETQGFMKILVDRDSKQILGATILGVGGDEVIHSLLTLMYAKAPYTAMQRAMHIHPTVSELLPTMLGDLKTVA